MKEDADAKKYLMIVTHSDDDQEKAGVALAVAATMISEELDLALVFMFRGVLLARKGVIETIAAPHLTAGKDLLPVILESKIPLYACTPCALTHGVGEEELLEGCRMITAVSLVPEFKTREVINF